MFNNNTVSLMALTSAEGDAQTLPKRGNCVCVSRRTVGAGCGLGRTLPRIARRSRCDSNTTSVPSVLSDGVWQACAVVDRAEANQRPPTLEDGARRVHATTSASQGNVEGEGPLPSVVRRHSAGLRTHYKHS